MKKNRLSHPAENHPGVAPAGFTLMEMLVVMSVIAILAALLLPAVSRAKGKAQRTVCLNNLRQLQMGWLMYAHDHNESLVSNDRFENRYWTSGKVNDGEGATNMASIRQGLLFSYVPAVGAYRCPSETGNAGMDGQYTVPPPRVRSYSMNSFMNGTEQDHLDNGSLEAGFIINKRLSDIRQPPPGQAVVFLDEHATTIDNGHFGFDPVVGNRRWVNLPASWHQNGCVFSFADGHSEHIKWIEPETLKLSGMSAMSRADNRDLLGMKHMVATRAQ